MPLAPDVPYEIGQPAYGGYVAGLIDTTQGNIQANDASQTGQRYMLIVAPALMEVSRAWSTTYGSPAAARTRWDGLSATQAMNSAEYPAAQYCAGLSYPSDGGSPWYLGAMDENETVYRNLKATAEANSTITITGHEFPGGSQDVGYNPSSGLLSYTYNYGYDFADGVVPADFVFHRDGVEVPDSEATVLAFSPGDTGKSNSLQLPVISDNQTADAYLTVEFAEAGGIEFYRHVSSEQGYDFYEFYIDDVLQERTSGESGWGKFTYGVASGTHTFRWRYTKDSSASGGYDNVRIHDVAILEAQLKYTPTFPAQTSVPAFRDGGGQDLGDAGTNIYYWSSTEYNAASHAWAQNFSGTAAGNQGYSVKTANYRVRPVRRVLVSDIPGTVRSPKIVGSVTDIRLNSSWALDYANGYAYVATYNDNTLTVVDVSDPSAPTVVGSVTDIQLENAQDVVYANGYAYVAAVDAYALVAVDVSNPSAPTIVGSVSGAGLQGATSVVYANGYVYVAAEYDNALTVVDVSNPTTPVIVGSVSAESLYYAQGVDYADGYAYVAAYDSAALTVVDVSNPSNPTIVGAVTDWDLLEGAQDVVYADGYAYVAAQYIDRLTVVDVSTPSNPTIVASITNTRLDYPNGVAYANGYVYVSARNSDALTVVDVSNPSAPTIVGSVSGAGLEGAFDVAYADGYAYVATRDSGSLTVIEAPANIAPYVIRTAPADGVILNGSLPQIFNWDFYDSDPGDTQFAYNWAWRPQGAPTWTETGWIALAATQHVAPPSTFLEGPNEWRVRVKDQAGVESEWSDVGFFTAYKAGSGSALLQVSSQATATGTVAYHFEGAGVISVAHSRSASGAKGAAGTGAVEQDSLPVVSSGLRNSAGKAILAAQTFVGIYTEGIGFGRLILTSSLFARGGKDTRGNGLLYVTDTPTIDGHKQQWYFTPPTRRVYGHGNRFWRRVYINQGVTVIRKGEALIVTETPSAEDFEEADRVYVGGYVYPIDDEERLALQAAGYDPFPEELSGPDGDG